MFRGGGVAASVEQGRGVGVCDPSGWQPLPSFPGLLQSTTSPPSFTQESLDALHPQLEDQRIETQRIQQGMIEIRRQAETQLRQVESEMQSKLEKLRNQLRLAFKEHSKQIINTRESVS